MYYAGLDIGSYYVKAVLTDKNGCIVGKACADSGAVYSVAADECLASVLETSGATLSEIEYAVITGIGNKSIADIVEFENKALITDVTCQARAISWLYPQARTILDVGGGSTKAISLDEYGCCRSFVHNEKCAAGSGRFMQIIANMLELSVEDIGKLSLEGTNPISFTTGCAVFAESDVITKIGEGDSAANILAGMNNAIASKLFTLMKRVGYMQKCVITGGAAQNIGLVKAIESAVSDSVLVPEMPMYTCALGAALCALSKAKEKS